MSARYPFLDAPNSSDVEIVRGWRNLEHIRPSLRTTELMTSMRQQEFLESLSGPRSPHRYWSVRVPAAEFVVASAERLVAFAGLTDIEWENGHAEISLIVNPALRGQGHGKDALDLLLREGFERMRLATLFGECYVNNPAAGWWLRRLEESEGSGRTILPRRKWWDGELYDSIMFWFVGQRAPEGSNRAAAAERRETSTDDVRGWTEPAGAQTNAGGQTSVRNIDAVFHESGFIRGLP